MSKYHLPIFPKTSKYFAQGSFRVIPLLISPLDKYLIESSEDQQTNKTKSNYFAIFLYTNIYYFHYFPQK